MRGTNRARVYGTVTGSRVLTFAAIDNLWKGAAGQAVQDLNLMLGPARDGGAGMTFFALSLGRAPRAREGARAHRAAGGLPERRASPPGIKPEGLDVGLLRLRRARHTVSAARFTTNALVAAPVAVCRESDLAGLRAVTANSGNANVVGRRARHGDRARPARRGRRGAGPRRLAPVGVASTGRDRAASCRATSWWRASATPPRRLAPNAEAFSESILTTDDGPKRACLEVALPSGASVRLAAQAKGGGHDLAELRHHALLRADRRRAVGGDG